MLAFSFKAPPFARSEEAFSDFPVTQKVQLNRLLKTLQSHQGLTALTVENNAPIVDIVAYLIAHLPDNRRTAQLETPGLSETEFLQSLCRALAIPSADDESSNTVPSLIEQILTALNTLQQLGESSPVLIVKEAHLAPDAVLHHIMALSSTSSEKPGRLSTVLIGGKELQNALMRLQHKAPYNAQVLLFNFPGLCELDTIDHVRGRMEGAGWKGPLPFDLDALKRIHAASNGLPQKINQICEQALNKAQESDDPTVTDTLVAQLLGQPAPHRPTAGQAMAQPSFDRPTARRQAPTSAPKPWLNRKWVTICGLALSGAFVATGLLLQPDEPAIDQAPANVSTGAIGVDQETAVVPAPIAEPSLTADGSATGLQPTVAATEALPVEPAIPVGEPLPALASLSDDTNATWVSIARRWGLRLNGKTACQDALEQGHQCFRLIDAKLPALKDIDRPGLIQLQQGGAKRWLELTEWTGDTLTLALGDQSWQIPSAEFTPLWTGRFTTFWRQPMDQTARIFASKPDEPAGRWLDRQLKKLEASGQLPATATTAQGRIAAFQKIHNLQGGGDALPSTFIKVNQLTGVTEPKLSR